MHTSLSFVSLTVLLLQPVAALALTVSPIQAETTQPQRAGTSVSSESGTPDRVQSPSDPQEGSVDYYLEIDGVEGESNQVPGVEPDEIDLKADPEEANADYYLKMGGVEGESTKAQGIEPDEIDFMQQSSAAQRGNVETEWKVEEGESIAPEDQEDVLADEEPQPVTPDFSILLGGGDDDAEELSEEARAAVADILKEGMGEADQPVETLSLNYEKLKTTARQPVKLFGFIPMDIVATVEIDAEENVHVQFPWWAVFTSGDDADALGQSVFNALTNAMKAKHDVMMNAIRNMR